MTPDITLTFRGEVFNNIFSRSEPRETWWLIDQLNSLRRNFTLALLGISIQGVAPEACFEQTLPESKSDVLPIRRLGNIKYSQFSTHRRKYG